MVAGIPNVSDEVHFSRIVSTSMATSGASASAEPLPFVSSWKTDNVGDSSDVQITLPLEASGDYDFHVEWGDTESDDITEYDDAAVTHTYSSTGTYTVTITGTFQGFRFNHTGDRLKLLDITQWGIFKFGNTGGYLRGCENLVSTATDVPDLTGMTNFTSIFENTAFNSDVSEWDVSNITTFDSAFRNSAFNHASIGVWEMGSALNIQSMFQDNAVFDQDIDDWDVSNVTTMALTFNNATAYNQPLNSWDVTSLSSMHWTFNGATLFNQPLNNWVTTSLTLLRSTFRDCAFDQSLSSWDTSGVTSMDSCFLDNTAFDQDLSNWDIEAVTVLTFMFSGATLSTANYDALLIAWAAQTVTSSMSFHGGNSTYSVGAATTAHDVLTDPPNSWTITDLGQA